MTEPWQSSIRRDHPRLFFNDETWPAIADRARGSERTHFDRMRVRVDAADAVPEPADWGTEAAAAAFIYRMTGDAHYLRRAVAFLETSIDFYHATRRAMRSVSWTSTTRINAWCAFDWIFNDLDEDTRSALGRSYLDHVEEEQPGPVLLPIPEWNFSGPETGFYGNMSLLWYAGLATAAAGIDDVRAADFLQRGRDTHVAMMRHRAHGSDDDGGGASVALQYAFGLYPWAEFNFLHTWEAATGDNVAGDWPHVALLANYMVWNWLPGARDFGAGDSYHDGNFIPLDHMWFHMAHVSHFYGEGAPAGAALGRWILEETDRISGGAGPDGINRARSHEFLSGRDRFPCHVFFLTRMHETAATPPGQVLPPARHFDQMGQTFMRSGSGPDDTYAMFTAGGSVKHHRHYDNNNLVIFRNGFQALDSGSRPNPGLHQTHYYGRTVAHNCILIHMPGELVPAYWGEGPAPGEADAPVPNDGGQCREIGSTVTAFETSDRFTYVAGDATAAYHAGKCALALRQVLFVPPDHFVVCDRVTSTDPGYRKQWLLHTVGEPAINGDMFGAAHEGGQLHCRTLLPRTAALEAIGGPGRQFWCGGRNWPMPEGFMLDGTEDALGQWRVEVSAPPTEQDTLFLHLIEVGDRDTTSTVRQAEVVETSHGVGVRLHTLDCQVEATFATEGRAAGHVKITSHDGEIGVDQALTGSVQKQAGVGGEAVGD